MEDKTHTCVALSDQTFSLDNILTDFIPGGVIAIVHGDREAIAANDHADV